MLRTVTRLQRALAVLLLAGCVASSGTAAAVPRSARDRDGRETHRVKMADRYRNVFRPRVIEIARGDSVLWVNVGNVTHTATTANWDSGAVAPGETYRRRFRATGTFPYVCVIHPEMTGRVVVS